MMKVLERDDPRAEVLEDLDLDFSLKSELSSKNLYICDYTGTDPSYRGPIMVVVCIESSYGCVCACWPNLAVRRLNALQLSIFCLLYDCHGYFASVFPKPHHACKTEGQCIVCRVERTRTVRQSGCQSPLCSTTGWRRSPTRTGGTSKWWASNWMPAQTRSTTRVKTLGFTRPRKSIQMTGRLPRSLLRWEASRVMLSGILQGCTRTSSVLRAEHHA